MLLEHGYNDLGIQNLLKETGVPKGSFYHHFGSKEDFALQVVGLHMDRVHEALDACVRDESRPPLERVRGFFEMTKGQYRQDGHLLIDCGKARRAGRCPATVLPGARGERQEQHADRREPQCDSCQDLHFDAPRAGGWSRVEVDPKVYRTTALERSRPLRTPRYTPTFPTPNVHPAPSLTPPDTPPHPHTVTPTPSGFPIPSWIGMLL